MDDDLPEEDAAGPVIDNTQPPVFLSGHRDGRVRLWDMACQVPSLLATVPHDLGGPGSKLRAVSAIHVRLITCLGFGPSFLQCLPHLPPSFLFQQTRNLSGPVGGRAFLIERHVRTITYTGKIPSSCQPEKI